MRNSMYVFAVSAFLVGSAARAEFWPNRPAVIRASEVLAEEVERFDEALHAVHAPAHVIQKVHHFEETVTEFVEIARVGTYQEASREFDHLRQDVQLIRDELSAHPQLLYNPRVAQEWRHVRTAYRNLDHQMFQHFEARLTVEEIEKLNKDLEEIEGAH